MVLRRGWINRRWVFAFGVVVVQFRIASGVYDLVEWVLVVNIWCVHENLVCRDFIIAI